MGTSFFRTLYCLLILQSTEKTVRKLCAKIPSHLNIYSISPLNLNL